MICPAYIQLEKCAINRGADLYHFFFFVAFLLFPLFYNRRYIISIISLSTIFFFFLLFSIGPYAIALIAGRTLSGRKYLFFNI